MIDISQIYNSHVYILVDADNVQLSPDTIRHLIAFANYFGRLSWDTFRAYGDWEKSPLNAHIELYDTFKFQRIQVNRDRKDATDYYMMMDIGSLLGFDLFGIFIIVSGDGIFASVKQFTENNGGIIVSIGSNKSTSQKLAESYSQFYFLEDLEDELIEIKKYYPIPPDKVRNSGTELFNAYDDIASKDWRWVSYDELDAKLREKYPTYVYYFEYPLSIWFSYLPKHFSIRDQMVQRIDPYPEWTRRGYMLRAYSQVAQENKGAHLSHFGKKIREIARNYEQEFGNKKLTDWIREYPNDFKIDGDYVIRISIDMAYDLFNIT